MHYRHGGDQLRNQPQFHVIDTRQPIQGKWPGNLSLFEYFLPQLRDQHIAIVGRYPGMDTYLSGLDVTVLEINPMQQTIAEGGGTRIFEGGVRYAVVDLTHPALIIYPRRQEVPPAPSSRIIFLD